MPGPDQDQEVIAAINRESSAGLRITGRAEHGTLGGAILVDLPNGGPGVVTRFLGSLSDARRTAELVTFVRRLGLPVARHHLVVPIGQDIFLVQERLSGEPPSQVTPEVMDAVVGLNDRFAHILSGRDDIPILPLCLRRSGNPFPRHEILAEHSDRSRRILDAITMIGERHPGEMVGDDLLHIDLDLSNVLFDQAGRVTGIVDWNLGAFRGDRHLALVKTRFEQEWALQSVDPDPLRVAAADHLDQILADRVAAPDLQKYWAHRLLYQLHWVLQSAPADVVDWHLAVAEARLL
jgi:aminoglycoside phosphotransferase (APT) family kinase protein